jgi:hypothetical protein
VRSCVRVMRIDWSLLQDMGETTQPRAVDFDSQSVMVVGECAKEEERRRAASCRLMLTPSAGCHTTHR